MKIWPALVAFGIFAAAVVTFATRAVTNRSAKIRDAESALRRQHDEARRVRDDTARLEREIGEADSQLRALAPFTIERDPEQLARRRETTDWVQRVRRLRELFAAAPDQRTPQMDLLTDEDWIRIALNADLATNTGQRRARARVRQEAITKLVPRIQAAIHGYSSATNDRPPNIDALANFMDPPLDSAILRQFEVADNPVPARGAPEPTWLVRNTAPPIDSDYDARFEIRRNGVGSGASVLMWDTDLRQRFQKATQEYTRANPRAAFNGMAELFPYFNPPLEKAKADRLLADEARGKE